MPRETINISVPVDVRRYIKDRVRSSGYASVSEYFRELLRADMLKHTYLTNAARRANGMPAIAPEYRIPAPAGRRK
jgi:Arc/MetJ-type ribon-helix-helix transcriptional regulator